MEMKITEEKLKEELAKGKTITQVAEEYNYSSINTLSQRINRYDWDILNKLAKPSNPDNKSRILSVNTKDIENAGFDPEKQLYYDKAVEDGKIIIEISEERIKEQN